VLGALIAIASFILGMRLGLAVGYRAERGRRIVVERRWLSELARVLGARPLELESVEAARERLLGEVRGQKYERLERGARDEQETEAPPQT
jgi:hypothetical protein